MGWQADENLDTYIDKHKTHDAVHSHVKPSDIFVEDNLLGNTTQTQPLFGMKTTPKLYPLGFGWPCLVEVMAESQTDKGTSYGSGDHAH